MKDIQPKQTASGFSLFELMIAITISSLLVIGVVTVYSSTKHTYNINQVNARLQENVRFAVSNIATEIRQAGYSGCGNYRSFDSPKIFAGKTITVNPSSDWKQVTDIPLQGYEGTGDVTIFPSVIQSTVDANSDAIIIYRAAFDDRVKFIKRTGPAVFEVNTKSHGIQNGDILLLTNCVHTAILQATKAETGTSKVIEHDTVSATPGNCTTGLYTSISCTDSPTTLGKSDNWNDQSNVTVRKWLPYLYYIAPSQADSSINSLYRLGLSGTPDELVEGVDSMQILYGVDTDVGSNIDGIANHFVKADAVANFNDVVSIRLGMLFSTTRSAKKKAGAAKSYTLAGTVITAPADRKSRQALNTTIKLRNLGAAL